jgi:hypothetical protein
MLTRVVVGAFAVLICVTSIGCETRSSPGVPASDSARVTDTTARDQAAKDGHDGGKTVMTGPSEKDAGVAPAETSKLVLSWSLEVVGGKLSIHYEIVNHEAQDAYVLNRPSTSQGGLDSEKVYRFERDGTLRLLLGVAPLPRRKSVLYRNVPFATRIAPNGTLKDTVALNMPVSEYSPYFAMGGSDEIKHVDRVVLLVDYFLAEAGIPVKAVPDMPGLFKATGASRRFVKMLLSEKRSPSPIEVKRRTDEFDRIDLPGEAPEPFFR